VGAAMFTVLTARLIYLVTYVLQKMQPFLRDKKIASKIIHVERANILAKTYKILTGPLETESHTISFVIC